MKLTWVSFADGRCLGVVLLVGTYDPIQAAILTRMAGINPGGEVLAIPADTNDAPEHLRPVFEDPANHNRLVPLVEATMLFEATKIDEPEPGEPS